MLAGREERAKPFARLGPQPRLAKPDGVEAKRERLVADQVARRKWRLTQRDTRS
jgi:hypothetical protein